MNQPRTLNQADYAGSTLDLEMLFLQSLLSLQLKAARKGPARSFLNKCVELLQADVQCLPWHRDTELCTCLACLPGASLKWQPRHSGSCGQVPSYFPEALFCMVFTWNPFASLLRTPGQKVCMCPVCMCPFPEFRQVSSLSRGAVADSTRFAV